MDTGLSSVAVLYESAEVRPSRSMRLVPTKEEEMTTITRLPFACLFLGALLAAGAAAQRTYGPGVTDTEIKLGQTMPYSGPASSLSTEGKTDLAYFTKSITSKAASTAGRSSSSAWMTATVPPGRWSKFAS